MNYTICLYDPRGLLETQSILISPIVSGMSVSDRVDTWLAEREQDDHMSALFPFLLFSLSWFVIPSALTCFNHSVFLHDRAVDKISVC